MELHVRKSLFKPTHPLTIELSGQVTTTEIESLIIELNSYLEIANADVCDIWGINGSFKVF